MQSPISTLLTSRVLQIFLSVQCFAFGLKEKKCKWIPKQRQKKKLGNLSLKQNMTTFLQTEEKHVKI